MKILGTIKNALVFPIAFLYVMLYLVYNFIHLFLSGNQVEYIMQILFVKIQNRLDKLVYRATWFTPIVYIILIIKIGLMIYYRK